MGVRGGEWLTRRYPKLDINVMKVGSSLEKNEFKSKDDNINMKYKEYEMMWKLHWDFSFPMWCQNYHYIINDIHAA